MVWENPKDADVTDIYGFDMDTDWLNGEVITNVVFTPAVDSGVIVSDVSLSAQPRVSAIFTGGNVGFWTIHIRVETPTRQCEFCNTLWVKQGC